MFCSFSYVLFMLLRFLTIYTMQIIPRLSIEMNIFLLSFTTFIQFGRGSKHINAVAYGRPKLEQVSRQGII